MKSKNLQLHELRLATTLPSSCQSGSNRHDQIYIGNQDGIRLMAGVRTDAAQLTFRVMRFALGMSMGDNDRLPLQYVSFGRSARPDPYLSLVDPPGSAPLTGQRPVLHSETRNREASGGAQGAWRRAYKRAHHG